MHLTPQDSQFLAVKTYSTLLCLCLLIAPRFSTGDDFSASESSNSPALAPRYAPPDTLSDGPPQRVPEERIPSYSAPSLLPPATLERSPYYGDSLQSGFSVGPRPAGRLGRSSPTRGAPIYEGLGTNSRNRYQSSEPGTEVGHDCSSHGSHSSPARPSSLPNSDQSRFRVTPGNGFQCQDGVCEFGYRDGGRNSRPQLRYRDVSPETPNSFEGGHDHFDGDGHSHGSDDQGNTPPNSRQSRCPVDGATLGSRGQPAALLVDGQPIYLCSEQCMMQLLRQSSHDSRNNSAEEFDLFELPSEDHNHSH